MVVVVSNSLDERGLKYGIHSSDYVFDIFDRMGH